MTPLTLTNFFGLTEILILRSGEIMDRQQPVSDNLKIALDNYGKTQSVFWRL